VFNKPETRLLAAGEFRFCRANPLVSFLTIPFFWYIERVSKKKFSETMAIVNRLGEIAKKRELSRYKVWKLTGLAQDTAYRLYSDRLYVPGQEVMDAVCSALDLQPGEWLQYVPDEDLAA
jgi:DNA-binding Xre family transcriptional regulator